MFGYYQFTKVKGRKAFLNIDANSLPMGFVLTVPQTQETPIVQGQSSWVSFGIVSRSEISGYVFLDTNADGVYTSGDIPVKDAVLMLETGVKANTGPDGRYVFRHAPLGEHTVTLDLNSLSVSYLPQVPLAKKIALNEGVTYIHNIPLKEIK